MDLFWYHFIRWSEVWALFIPLTIIILYKIKTSEFRTIVFYVWTAVPISLIANAQAAIIHYGDKTMLPDFLQTNHILYNVHSIIRVLLFGWLITNIRLMKEYILPRIAIPLYIILLIANFSFRGSIWSFDPFVFVLEGLLLLTLCLSFFFLSIKDNSETIWMDEPVFIICAGISLYEAINFFIFLFFDALQIKNPSFGRVTMEIFSVSYIILCILLAIMLFRLVRYPVQKRKLNLKSTTIS